MVPWTSKQHLDRFSHFCTAHPCDQYTDTNTYRPTDVLRETSVAIGCIYALLARERPINYNKANMLQHE